MLKQKMKILILGLACTFGFSITGVAQIVTAPLDPTQPVFTGAAAGWRMKAAAVGSYFTGSGKRSVEALDVFEFTRSGNTAGITLPWGPVAFEASSTNWSQQTTLAQTYEGNLPISFSVAEAHVGLNHDHWASIGVSTKDIKEKVYIGTDATEDSYSENSLGGSLSLQMGEMFFLGLGTNDVKSAGDRVVQNRWKETQFGMGLIFGSPGESQFRVESSFISSPEMKKEAFDTKGAAYHPKSKSDFNQVEFSISGLVFAVRERREQSTTEYLGADGTVFTNTSESAVTESGVLWVPQNGLVLGFYFVNEKATGTYEDTHSLFRINSGYIF